MRIRKTAAAALVPASPPQALNVVLAVAKDARIAISLCIAAIIGSHATVYARGEAKGLDMTAGGAHGEDRLAGVQGRGEDVRVEREGAEVLEHGGQKCELLVEV